MHFSRRSVTGNAFSQTPSITRCYVLANTLPAVFKNTSRTFLASLRDCSEAI